MNTLAILVSRNIKLYIRDRLGVFFSFLAAMIIILLYALFLRNNLVSSVTSNIGDVKAASWIVDSWLMAGIIVVNSITVSLGLLGLMITDQTQNRLRGFLSAPIKRSTIVTGYLVAAWIIGSALTILTFILSEIYIKMNGGELLSLVQVLKTIGLIVLNVFSGTSIIFFFVSLMKTESAFQTFSTILGTLIGFATGIYVPIGVLSASIQTFTKLIPATFGVSLMRQVFMEEPLKIVFAGAPKQAMIGFEKFFGSQVYFGSYQCPPFLMVLILFLSGTAFIGLTVLIVNRKKN